MKYVKVFKKIIVSPEVPSYVDDNNEVIEAVPEVVEKGELIRSFTAEESDLESMLALENENICEVGAPPYAWLLSECYRKRREAYPSTGDQLDAAFKARQGDDTKQNEIDVLIAQVKIDFPKPVQQ